MFRALDGLKILDLTMNLPGPYMTWLLAQLGAEVVKIENPAGGDYARAIRLCEDSAFFAAVNRNKKSATLNLKHPEGKRLLLELIDLYDVMVEGFRPGAMERLGLGFEVTSARNPRLIHVSITGYGHDGPYRLRSGHDINYLSLAGIIGMTGSKNGELAVPGIQVADLAGGSLLGLIGLLVAIIQREKTGRGQFVDTSIFHGSLSLATMVFAGVETGFERPEPCAMTLNGRFPCYGLYRTKDNGYMSLGALEPKFWVNFCEAVGREDLMGGQFGGPDVVSEMERLFASRTKAEWVSAMKQADACCEPVLSLDDAVTSELTQVRSMVKETSDGKRFLASPLRMTGSPPVDDTPPPGLGQHTRDVLSQLELTDQEMESLARFGVI